MNREIKFRAWEKAKERMLTGDEILLEYLDRASVTPFNKIFSSGYFEWMQYTGLKDKNGKEVFEGDILLSEKPMMLRAGNHRVVVEKEFGGFVCREIFEREDEEGEKYYPTFSLTQKQPNLEELEIIGNIYENPNLLNP